MKYKKILGLLPVYSLVVALSLLVTVGGSKTITVMSESMPLKNRRCVIIDPGHGGVDGGATSCTGVLESHLNLEISLRLNDLFRLLGYDTVMIRTEDCSIHTSGQTIAEKKVSDLKARVKLINETENAFLVSIHQNYFSDGRYSGAQVFYPSTEGSEQAAGELQSALISALNPGSNRKSKRSTGVYLMEHVTCTGVLVECGFLSNVEEEARLRSDEYQKNLCCVIASTVSNFLDRQTQG